MLQKGNLLILIPLITTNCLVKKKKIQAAEAFQYQTTITGNIKFF